MHPHRQLQNLLGHLIYESHQTELLLQLAALLACGALSWILVRLASHSLTGGADPERRRRIIHAIGLPLGWLLLADFARDLLRPDHEVHLLNIAIPLLLALILIRTGVLLLRHLTGNRDIIRIWGRVIVWTIWTGFALHITGLLPVMAEVLDSIAFESGNHRFSLLLLLEAIAVVTLAIVTALWLSQLIEARLMRTSGMNPSLRLALIKTVRTVLLITSVLIALPAVGIDITVLSVFGGALGVGLGLGLQKVASNYVSGFIILLDRSIRPGDMITVDGHYGEVRQLNTRYTLLRVLDGTEIILPNETLMTSTVVNHSFTQREVSVKIPVQIGYDSDVERACAILTEIGAAHPRTLKNEPFNANSYLTSFGDSGINLALLVWILDPELGQIGLTSDINRAIWQRFAAEGIDIPYPRRDVHVFTEHLDNPMNSGIIHPPSGQS